MSYTLILEQNRAILEEWKEWRKPRKDHMENVLHFIEELNKPLQDVDELDINKDLEKHAHTALSWNKRLSNLRQFFAWIKNKDTRLPKKKWKPAEFFELVEWKKETEWKYSAEDMWTEEEILLAISVLDHPRDKALVALSYDLAARPVEILRLKVKNIIMQENYAKVQLKDHSNPNGRVIPITLAFQYVLTWLNNHPLKEHPDAPLWIRLQGTPKAIGYGSLWRLCTVELKNKIGHKVHKPFNPYCIFNHSRLTELAPKMKEFQLKAFRGWKMNSKMPQRYIHLSGESVTDAMLEISGIKKVAKGEEKESPLKSKRCYRCKQDNTPDAKFCVKCNFVLSAEGYEEIRKKEEEQENRIKRLEEKQEAMNIGMSVTKMIASALGNDAKGIEIKDTNGNVLMRVAREDLLIDD